MPCSIVHRVETRFVVWCGNGRDVCEKSVNDYRKRPFQFSITDVLVLVTIIAAGIGLWRYETLVNPDRLGVGGVLLQVVRMTWNLIFAANLCLIGWVRWRAWDGALARRQWRVLVMLSAPPLVFFLLILIGMSWGSSSFEVLRGWLAFTWFLSVVCLVTLLYGLTVEAASPPHRMFHLVALSAALLAVFATCCG